MPSVLETRKADIEKAIAGITEEFDQNIFPEMGASWDAYASHIGHKTYNGCFRCHDDKHESENGESITKDCNLCHTIVFQGKPGQEQFASLDEKLEFVHPKELKEDWHEGLCSECHRYLYP